MKTQHRSIILTVLVFCLNTACSTSGPGGTAGDSTTQTTPEAETTSENSEPICTPGETRCTDAGPTGREQCSEDGTAWEDASCDELETCVDDGYCAPPLCTPGDRRCAEDGTIEACIEDGSAWVTIDDSCEATEICMGGQCQNLCENALARSSYDGCEFHAVDLPQIATPEFRYDEYPFAVVVANPHPVPAHVTITKSGDVVTELIAQQTVVEPEHAQIGLYPRSTDVFSEVRDENGVVTHISGPASNLEVPPFGMGTFILPNQSAGMLVTADAVTYQSEVADKAYRVTTDVPVTAYQFQPICCSQSFTNDATILFPSGSLGTRYRAVSLPMFQTLPGFVSIIAGSQPTQVDVHIGEQDIGTPSGFEINDGVATGNLQPYEVMTLFGRGEDAITSDLTGIEIVSTEEVSVIGGHACSNAPHVYAACDHLETILMPVDAWRDEFVLAHTFHRSDRSTEVNYYRIVADTDGTIIETEPRFSDLNATGPIGTYQPECILALHQGSIRLDAGEWCEFGTRQSFTMSSTHPVQVVQALPGSTTAAPFGWSAQAPGDSDTNGDDGIPFEQMGDPAFTLVPPSDQFRTNYTFLMPDTYERNFVNVLHRLGDDIYFDGIDIQSTEDTERVMKVHEEPIGQSDWHLTILEVSPGPHFMSNPSGDAFGIMVYAYDRDVSYAFPGGLNLLKR